MVDLQRCGLLRVETVAIGWRPRSGAAEDIRRESLAFLWIRRFLRNARNVHVIRGDTDDPHLPPRPVDAVLIANTYHELDRRSALLSVLFHAMRSGGRLVVVDRGPRTSVDSNPGAADRGHDLRPEVTADEIQQSGFELVNREDRFIDRPGEEGIWWLIVARNISTLKTAIAIVKNTTIHALMA